MFDCGMVELRLQAVLPKRLSEFFPCRIPHQFSESQANSLGTKMHGATVVSEVPTLG